MAICCRGVKSYCGGKVKGLERTSGRVAKLRGGKFRSGSCRMQIDYYLIRANHRSLCRDCKVIPSEFLGTQHRLLVMDMVIKGLRVKRRSGGVARVRWWNFTRENATKLSERIRA